MEKEKITADNITPEHYYQWGDEPTGYVTCGLYLNDLWYNCGIISKKDAENNGLTYHCPFN